MTGGASSDCGLEARDAVDRIIKARFACRAFCSRQITRRALEEILEVARFAPSGANIQPWRVYVVSGKKKEEISQSLLRAHQEARDEHSAEYRYYASPLPEPYSRRQEQFGRLFYGSLGIPQRDKEGRARQTSKNYSFFGAPAGLIIAIDRRLQVGSWLDLGMFIQNVMIAAGVRGLHTCPQETFAKYHSLLRKLLPLSPEEIVVCGMSIGFADGASAAAGTRMPKAAVEEFAQFLGFED
jgi:nitroreductase